MARASGLTQTGCCSATDHPAAAPTDNALMHDHCHRPGDARSPAKSPPAPDGTIYTCPMHQQIRQVGPGVCPICGMALEPELASAEAAPNPELADMTRRFWIALVLTLPVLALEMGGHLTNLHVLLGQNWSNWLQFVLATPVVLWAREQTSGAIRALLDLAPKTARRLNADAREEEVSLDAIAVGDRLRVRPGEKVPVDG